MDISVESARKFAKLNSEIDSSELFGSKQKRSWTVDEDSKLCQLVKVYGSVGKESWQAISENFPGRSVVACRQHWAICTAPNYENKSSSAHGKSFGSLLNPVSNNSNEWTELENMMLLNSYLMLGTNWNKIAQTEIPTRDPYQIQNQWQKHICPCIRKFFVNYYQSSKSSDGRDPSVVDTSCPLYGISDIPFISQALIMKV